MLRRLKDADPELYQILADTPRVLCIGIPLFAAGMLASIVFGTPIVGFIMGIWAIVKEAVFG